MAASSSIKAQRITKRIRPTEYIDIYRDSATNFYFWKLKHNSPYIVRLHNVNRLVYTGTKSEETGTDLFTQVPTAFTGVVIPAFSTKSFSTTPNPFVEKKAWAPGKSKKPCTCTSPDTLIESSTLLKSIYARLKDSVKQINQFAASMKSISEIQDSITTLKEDISSPWDTPGVTSILQRKNDVLKRFQSTIHDYRQTSLIKGYKIVIDNTDSLSKSIARSVDSVSNGLMKYLSDSQCYDTAQLARKLDCLKCSDKNYNVYLDSLNFIRECVVMYEQKIESLKVVSAMANKLVTEMRSDDIEKKLTAMQKDYDLITVENYNYTVDAFIADHDVHDVTISIISPNPVGQDQPQNRFIHVKGITTCGVKVDFSTGVFFNWGNNEFLGPDYYYKTIDSVNKQVVEAERTKKTMFSLGALAHFYWRMNSSIVPALSVGVSTTSTFKTVNFHAGISALIGKPGSPNRLVLTGGVTLREVSLLDNRYQLNTSYTDLPDAVPTSENFPKYGGFFAITYNFFSSGSK